MSLVYLIVTNSMNVLLLAMLALAIPKILFYSCIGVCYQASSTNNNIYFLYYFINFLGAAKMDQRLFNFFKYIEELDYGILSCSKDTNNAERIGVKKYIYILKKKKCSCKSYSHQKLIISFMASS